MKLNINPNIIDFNAIVQNSKKGGNSNLTPCYQNTLDCEVLISSVNKSKLI